MAEVKKRVPKRRFKEFQDAEVWEERELREIASRYDNLRVPITASDRIAGKTPYYGANGIQDYVEGFTHEGEFVLIAEDGANDLKNYPVQYVNGKIWVNNHAHVLQTKENIADNRFLKNVISKADIEPYLVGGGRAKLNAEIMMGINIKLPSNLEEQQKIGSFFQNLDSQITLQQRKLEKIKAMKKAYLSEMFPAAGQTKPKRRFKGFTEDWVEMKLGELGSVSMCKRIFKAQTKPKGDVPFYKIGTFGSETDAYISKELFEEYKAKFSYPKKGSILISASGSIGRTVVFSGKDEYFQDSNIIWLEHNDRIIDPFLKHLYSIIKWSGVEGTTIKRLYNDNVLKTEIMLPSIEEQEKISSYFDNLDKQITLHQKKLSKLQDLKKAYLNEMFI
jgi:Restriction endonuclease S subunits